MEMNQKRKCYKLRQECSKNQIGRKPTTQVRMRQKVTKLKKMVKMYQFLTNQVDRRRQNKIKAC